jgi:D-lactate dehydrogenase
MRLFVYGCRPYDEAEAFHLCEEHFDIELGYTVEQPNMENAHLAQGYEAISIVSTPMPGTLIAEFHRLGVKMISTRTVGYDHVDLETAKKLGVHVSNATYSPDCVADYTVMLMLMALRKMKRILQRADIHDFSLPGTIGKELHNCTVGVLGAGKIGRRVIQDLSGFGCEVLAYGHHPDDSLHFVSLEEILTQSDILTFHMPLGQDNYHMIGAKEIAKMKDGVVIINTARGGLIDTEALISGLESGKIGAAALDVVENEGGLFHFDKKSEQIAHRQLSILKDMPNVIFSPHMAFYTQEAIGDMVGHSVESCVLELSGQENPWHIC